MFSLYRAASFLCTPNKEMGEKTQPRTSVTDSLLNNGFAWKVGKHTNTPTGRINFQQWRLRVLVRLGFVYSTPRARGQQPDVANEERIPRGRPLLAAPAAAAQRPSGGVKWLIRLFVLTPVALFSSMKENVLLSGRRRWNGVIPLVGEMGKICAQRYSCRINRLICSCSAVLPSDAVWRAVVAPVVRLMWQVILDRVFFLFFGECFIRGLLPVGHVGSLQSLRPVVGGGFLFCRLPRRGFRVSYRWMMGKNFLCSLPMFSAFLRSLHWKSCSCCADSLR